MKGVYRFSTAFIATVGAISVANARDVPDPALAAEASSPDINMIQGLCDRTCLRTLADRYLQSMIAKDQTQLRWSARARYTENGMELRVGEGLWA